MSKIYQGQSKVTIRINAGSSLEGVTEALVTYRKPDKVIGTFPGDITDVEGGIVEYQVLTEEELDVVGIWTFWLALTFSDGRKLVSNVAKLRINKVGY